MKMKRRLFSAADAEANADEESSSFEGWFWCCFRFRGFFRFSGDETAEERTMRRGRRIRGGEMRGEGLKGREVWVNEKWIDILRRV